MSEEIANIDLLKNQNSKALSLEDVAVLRNKLQSELKYFKTECLFFAGLTIFGPFLPGKRSGQLLIETMGYSAAVLSFALISLVVLAYHYYKILEIKEDINQGQKLVRTAVVRSKGKSFLKGKTFYIQASYGYKKDIKINLQESDYNSLKKNDRIEVHFSSVTQTPLKYII